MKSLMPKIRPNLVIREAEGELLVLDRHQGKIHKFNHSAAVVLGCCDGHHTVDQIIDRVAATYGAAIETVRRDVADTVGEMSQLGLFVSTNGHEGE